MQGIESKILRSKSLWSRSSPHGSSNNASLDCTLVSSIKSVGQISYEIWTKIHPISCLTLKFHLLIFLKDRQGSKRMKKPTKFLCYSKQFLNFTEMDKNIESHIFYLFWENLTFRQGHLNLLICVFCFLSVAIFLLYHFILFRSRFPCNYSPFLRAHFCGFYWVSFSCVLVHCHPSSPATEAYSWRGR